MAAGNENDSKTLMRVNATFYVRTRKTTAITLWLPDATESDGEPIEVKDADGEASIDKPITVKTLKSQTIDGASTHIIAVPYGKTIFRSNGQQWYTLAQHGSVLTTYYKKGSTTSNGALVASISTTSDRTYTVYARWSIRCTESGGGATDPAAGSGAMVELIGSAQNIGGTLTVAYTTRVSSADANMAAGAGAVLQASATVLDVRGFGAPNAGKTNNRYVIWMEELKLGGPYST